MISARQVLKKGARWTAFATIVAIGIASIVGSLHTRPETGEIVLGIWRSGGNAVLTLNSDIAQGVSEAIDLSSEPYPPDATNDEAFYTRARINSLMGGAATLQSFELQCGYDTTSGETSRITDIVFWSSDHWEGTSQRFRCGPSNTTAYEVAGTISNGVSFCIVSDRTGNPRRARCLNGPRCDDGRRNGSESDVDCGGTCPQQCGTNRTCNSIDDNCISGRCANGVCQAPSCSDNVKNGDETDVDCGGSCGQCPVGSACNHNWECESGRCWNNKTECVPGPSSTSSSYCTGLNSCSLLGQSDCSSRDGCWWGTHTGFESLGPRCNTNESSCTLCSQLRACSSYGTSAACSAQGGCTWSQ